MTEDDLEDDWALLRRTSPIRLITGRGGDTAGQIEFVATTTMADLTKEVNLKYHNHPVTGELLSDVALMAVSRFLKNWHAHLKGLNLPGLIEIVLEGQDLSPEEMKGFMKAIPTSLLRRIAESAVGSASGTHGLVAVEFAQRQGRIASYTIDKRQDRVCVEFQKGADTVLFFLDEPFDLAD